MRERERDVDRHTDRETDRDRQTENEGRGESRRLIKREKGKGGGNKKDSADVGGNGLGVQQLQICKAISHGYFFLTPFLSQIYKYMYLFAITLFSLIKKVVDMQRMKSRAEDWC